MATADCGQTVVVNESGEGSGKDRLLKIREFNSKQLLNVHTDMTTGKTRGAGFPMRFSEGLGSSSPLNQFPPRERKSGLKIGQINRNHICK